MPIFEYRCRACGKEFEKLVSSSARSAQAGPKTICKVCGSPQVERLLSAFAVIGPSRSSSRVGAVEPGPCGACGAPRRGMCGE